MEAPPPLDLLRLPTWAQRGAPAALARDLVHVGGSADASDARLMEAALATLPPRALEMLRAEGIRVVVCRGYVVDYRPDLKGLTTSDGGKTYDTVPGVYIAEAKEIVVRTRDHAAVGGPILSAHTVAHEVFHALDHGHSASEAFLHAAAMEPKSMALIAGDPHGLGELFADSAASFHTGDSDLAAYNPALYAYWATDPLGLKR